MKKYLRSLPYYGCVAVISLLLYGALLVLCVTRDWSLFGAIMLVLGVAVLMAWVGCLIYAIVEAVWASESLKGEGWTLIFGAMLMTAYIVGHSISVPKDLVDCMIASYKTQRC